MHADGTEKYSVSVLESNAAENKILSSFSTQLIVYHTMMYHFNSSIYDVHTTTIGLLSELLVLLLLLVLVGLLATSSPVSNKILLVVPCLVICNNYVCVISLLIKDSQLICCYLGYLHFVVGITCSLVGV
jgi:hypothetical protein